MIKDLPYTKLIFDQILQTIEKIELPKSNIEFETGAKTTKEEITKQVKLLYENW